MNRFLDKILNYINENYDVNAIKKSRYSYNYNIYISTEKYDLNIGISQTKDDCYLFGKSDYYLSFDYDANKKYKTELCYHSGGYIDTFNVEDFSNIDKFLSRWLQKKEFKQTTIFDFITEE